MRNRGETPTGVLGDFGPSRVGLATRIAAAYAAVAIIYIAFSDALVTALIADAQTAQFVHTGKGFVFVGITALLLALLIGRAFRRLDLSERLYRALYETTDHAVLLVDSETRINAANPAACQLFRIERTRLVGLSLADLVARPGAAPFRALEQQFLETGNLKSAITLRRDDGARLQGAISARAFRSTGNRRCSTVVIDDRSEESRLSGLVERTDRLRLAGMAAGIFAREVRYLADGLQERVEWLLLELSGRRGDVAAFPLSEAARAAVRLSGLAIRQRLWLDRSVPDAAGPPAADPAPVDLAVLAAEAMERLRPLVPAGIDLRHDGPHCGLLVRADRLALEIGLAGLLGEALDAVTGGWANTGADGDPAETSTGWLKLVVYEGLDEDGQPVVLVSIADSGHGRRGAEALGTAELPGSIGSVLAAAGGRWAADSQTGVGTSVRLIFPRCEAPVDPQALWGEGGGLLVVARDSAVRIWLAELLRAAGHRVVEAGSRSEVAALLPAGGAGPGLILIDCTAPGAPRPDDMTPRDLSAVLAARAPSCPVLQIGQSPVIGGTPGGLLRAARAQADASRTDARR